jgi:hypothetical protein
MPAAIPKSEAVRERIWDIIWRLHQLAGEFSGGMGTDLTVVADGVGDYGGNREGAVVCHCRWGIDEIAKRGTGGRGIAGDGFAWTSCSVPTSVTLL